MVGIIYGRHLVARSCIFFLLDTVYCSYGKEGGKWRLPAGRWSSVVTLRVFCCPLSRQVVFTSWIRYNEAGFLHCLLFFWYAFVSCLLRLVYQVFPIVLSAANDTRKGGEKRKSNNVYIIFYIYLIWYESKRKFGSSLLSRVLGEWLF